MILALLINPDTRRLDHFRPRGQFLPDEVSKLRGRAPHRMRAYACKAFVELGRLYRLDDGTVEPVDDRAGCARRHDDALPFDRFVARYAGLGNGRYSGERRIGL